MLVAEQQGVMAVREQLANDTLIVNMSLALDEATEAMTLKTGKLSFQSSWRVFVALQSVVVSSLELGLGTPRHFECLRPPLPVASTRAEVLKAALWGPAAVAYATIEQDVLCSLCIC